MAEDRNLQTVASLEPAEVWRHFARLASIPRPSKKEAQARQHVRRVAEEAGFRVRQDGAGNLVIEVPATRGHEKAPIVVLQGHLDMVCEKNSGTPHDFDRDPIRLRILGSSEEQVVMADGTTLGADNGIGAAMALAAATSADVVHGPLEILLTVDEEAGMTGAKALEAGFLKGRRMLNLDSEEDDRLYIGCAGGCDTVLRWNLPLHPIETGQEWIQVTISGLRGGHSGGEIHENRGSAVQVLIWLLLAEESSGARLLRIEGGSKRNAIAREASAVVAIPAGRSPGLSAAAGSLRESILREQGEADCRIDLSPAEAAAKTISLEDSQRVLRALHSLPHGVLAVVPEIPGLVKTSNNVATVETDEESGALSITAGCLSRSSSAFDLGLLTRRLASIGRLAGAAVESGNCYPGWRPDFDSPILEVARRVYSRLFGIEPVVTAIHAGLECGIIGERVGGMDMISLGPTIRGAHSPDERVYVTSVGRSWNYLRELLKELTNA